MLWENLPNLQSCLDSPVHIYKGTVIHNQSNKRAPPTSPPTALGLTPTQCRFSRQKSVP